MVGIGSLTTGEYDIYTLIRLALSETIPAQGVRTIRPRAQEVKLGRGRPTTHGADSQLGTPMKDPRHPIAHKPIQR